MSIKLPGKDSQIYKAIRDNLRPILEGTILVVDPSIGSASSQPGWALFKQGQLVDASTLTIDPRGEKWERLRELHRLLRNLSKEHAPDICLYEQVPVTGHGGRSQVSHASLLYAVGVTMAAVQADAFIGVTPIVWKSRVPQNYVKGDMEDAIAMGHIVVEIAAAIQENDSPKRYNT